MTKKSSNASFVDRYLSEVDPRLAKAAEIGAGLIRELMQQPSAFALVQLCCNCNRPGDEHGDDQRCLFSPGTYWKDTDKEA